MAGTEEGILATALVRLGRAHCCYSRGSTGADLHLHGGSGAAAAPELVYKGKGVCLGSPHWLRGLTSGLQACNVVWQSLHGIYAINPFLHYRALTDYGERNRSQSSPAATPNSGGYSLFNAVLS